MNLDEAKTREEAIDYLNGYSADRTDDLFAARTRRPLVKSYMLETVPSNCPQPSLASLFASTGNSLHPIDATMHQLYDPAQGKVVALVEQLTPRHPVLYTTEDSHVMDGFVKRLVQSHPLLDNLWISGRLFQELFEIVLKITPLQRFGRLVFQHTSVYETESLIRSETATEQETETDQSDSDEVTTSPDGEEVYIPERRTTKSTMIDRLDVLRTTLPKMRKLYEPMYSIAQLRFPAKGRGGHDFYFHGKVTNRSDSFADHRQNIQFVLQLYQRATELTEEIAWQDIESTTIHSGRASTVVIGAPVLLEFSRSLSKATFDAFITQTFHRKLNRFRLWGDPIALGPTKVHVYGIDRHIWKPIFLEITHRQIVAIVPHGTCGNSVHRLITNVQQFLDPGVKVWVGDRDYSSIIQESSSQGGTNVGKV